LANSCALKAPQIRFWKCSLCQFCYFFILEFSINFRFSVYFCFRILMFILFYKDCFLIYLKNCKSRRELKYIINTIFQDKTTTQVPCMQTIFDQNFVFLLYCFFFYLFFCLHHLTKTLLDTVCFGQCFYRLSYLAH